MGGAIGLDIVITQKSIKEKCGTVSFKRGDAFYRADKVIIQENTDDQCTAIVQGTEDFHVKIERRDAGGYQSHCSCPKLASVKNDCQHVAAVLIALYEQQRVNKQQKMPATFDEGEQNISNDFLTLFNNEPRRARGHQYHFENREILDIQFLCKPVEDDNRQLKMAIAIDIASNQVEDIHSFLMKVDEGLPVEMGSFYYDPKLHCFERVNDSVLQQLIQVVRDENAFVSKTKKQPMLIIPASAWEKLVLALNQASGVKVQFPGFTVNGLHLSEGPLPLKFELIQTEGNQIQLKVEGLAELIVLHPYQTVMAQGKLVQLKKNDFTRLHELIRMLEPYGRSRLPIQKNQLGFFIDKVVPRIKQLGEVKIPSKLTKEMYQTPLKAKLYLDRVNNRLLAGLEFHYGSIAFNPLDHRERRAASMVIRDEEKENMIIDLMEESEFGRTESGYFLHNEQKEYEFLYHTVPKLQKLVQLYATTAVRNRMFKGNQAPRIQIKVKKQRTNWLEFKFKMDGIADHEIKEVLQALEEKRKYYRLRNGAFLSLETKEFEEIERFLKALPIEKDEIESEWRVPLVRGLGLLDKVGNQDMLQVEESFREFLKELTQVKLDKFKVPDQLGPILREYQVAGFQWMKTLASYGFGGILADDMGLGKTVQSIAFILSELEQIRSERCPALIVCPSSLSYNWLSEWMKFAPEIHAIVLDGHHQERKELQKQIKEMDVVITSYPLLRQDIVWFEKQSFHVVFFDEAQNFKNPLTQTARAVKKLKANHRFALTGTPMENSLEELWSIFHVVFPELFLGLKEFSQLTQKQISRRIRPFMLRRVKEDVLGELPKKVESLEFVDLLPEQKKLYGAYLAKLRHDTLKHLDKDTFRKNKIKILAGLTRLRQICCHPALFVDSYQGGSAKFDQLIQIVEEARIAGRRLLIFSQFTKMLEIIGRELAIRGLPFFYLDGQTPSNERVNLCDKFNKGERDFFLISLKAGGTGLNLTGADTVILYDLWWNPAVEEQAADRVHRMGQTKKVEVIKMVTRGSIEEKMNELQARKKHLIDEIIEANEDTSSLNKVNLSSKYSLILKIS